MGEFSKKKIYVGLSGGVDSSVAAALLQKNGHDVHAVYLKVWSPDLEDLMKGCPWEEDVRYAEATATHLRIPFEVWDVSKEYFDRVVEYFVAVYRRGRTPNPDVMCNREIKFGIFLDRALKEGADMIATGHYTRLEREFPISHRQGGIPLPWDNFQFSNKSHDTNYKLLKAKDLNKDQSYFLYALTQEQLRYALFPIGEFTKPEVRRMAKEFGLPTADRKDSQGICFLGKIPVKEFLKLRIPAREGALVTTSGRVIGTHEGAEFYTIGQRHGIGSRGGGTAYYVSAKDVVANTVVVAEGNDDAALYADRLVLDDIHWISGRPPEVPLDCMARIRYRQPVQECTVFREHGVWHVLFKEKQRAATTGQSAVFYLGDEMLGGGSIAETEKS